MRAIVLVDDRNAKCAGRVYSKTQNLKLVTKGGVFRPLSESYFTACAIFWAFASVKPACSRRAAALSVASQVKSGS